MENNKDIEQISKKLSVLISLLLSQDKNYKTTKEKTEYLNKFDLSNLEMSKILNTSKNTVDVYLTNLKKGKK